MLRNYNTILTTLDILTLKPLLNEIAKEVNLINGINYLAIDTEEIIDAADLTNCKYVNNGIDAIFTELYNNIKDVEEVYRNNNFDKKSIENYKAAIILIALDTLKAETSQLINEIASENIVFILTKNNTSSMKKIGILKEDNRNILIYCKDNSLELINKYYE